MCDSIDVFSWTLIRSCGEPESSRWIEFRGVWSVVLSMSGGLPRG